MSNDLALPFITRLFNIGGIGTAKDMEIGQTVYVHRLQAEGLVEYVGDRKGQRGRPAHVYKLTDKARKRVRRALGR